MKFTLTKRKHTLRIKLQKLGLDHLTYLLNTDSPHLLNINHKTITNKKKLDEFLYKYKENKMNDTLKNKSHKNWKTKNYYQILKMQNKRWKQQKYLSWESAKTILKLRGATCGLNRYSYVTTKYKSKVDQKCPNCNHPTEDIDHFLWDCTFYKDEREKWFLELCHIDEFRAIFYQKDSLKLLSRLNLFYFFKPSLFYILNALTLRVNRK